MVMSPISFSRHLVLVINLGNLPHEGAFAAPAHARDHFHMPGRWLEPCQVITVGELVLKQPILLADKGKRYVVLKNHFRGFTL